VRCDRQAIRPSAYDDDVRRGFVHPGARHGCWVILPNRLKQHEPSLGDR